MSRYATWENLVQRYPSASKASANADMDEAFISPAEAEIDWRLGGKVTTPFTAPIPELIKSLTIDVAFYKLTMRTKESKTLHDYLYGCECGIFPLILAGKIPLTASTAGNSAWVDKEYSSRFGVDDPINWQPDCDSIVDANEERF